MTVIRAASSPAEIRFSRIDDRASVRTVASRIGRSLALLERNNCSLASGVPLAVLRIWVGLQVPDGTLLAAVAYLGHQVRVDPTAVSADHRVLVSTAATVGHLDNVMLARARVQCPEAVQVHLVCRTGRDAEDPWMVRGCLERLAAGGRLEAVDGDPASVWRIPSVASS